MKLRLLPSTNSGRWSVFAMVIEIVLFTAVSSLPWKDGSITGIDIIAANPLPSVLTALMFACGVIVIITSFFSIVRKKEPAILVFAALLTGIYCTLAATVTMVKIF